MPAGKLKVTPRLTWYDDFEKNVLAVEITLDNTDEEYRFAYNVTRDEMVRMPGIGADRAVAAAKVLMADYERAHG